MSLSSNADEAAALIRSRSPLEPRLAVVLGSGLGAFARTLGRAVRIPFAQVPHLRPASVPGHAGEIVLGTGTADVPIVVFSGRLHLYEGLPPEEVAFPVRIAARLGARVLVVTNASGSVNVNCKPGELLLITDQINLTGSNPLAGPDDPVLGPRFVDMTDAYDPALITIAEKACWKIGIPVRKGVYVGVAGPAYETPAEVRMTRTLGGDVVGMSTVLEVIAARQMKLRVLGISCVTNTAAGVSKAKLDHAAVLETAQKTSAALQDLLTAVVQEVGARREGGA